MKWNRAALADFEDLADELVGLEPVVPAWSLKSFCTATSGALHEGQWAVCNDNGQWIHLLCARQSGKTQVDGGIIIDRWRRYPDSLHIFVGLNGVAVRQNAWIPVWQRTLDRYGVMNGKLYKGDERQDDNGIMLSRNANGARALFAGTDDLKHVRNLLGNRLHNGTLIIDESQDQPPEIIDYLLDVVLPPMMTPTTLVIMSGVRPDLPTGRFYKERYGGRWSHHSFARWANVHTPEARAQLMAYLEACGITWEEVCRLDPEHETFDKDYRPEAGKFSIILRVLRDWLNRDVYDPAARTYMYRDEMNGYTPTVPGWAKGFRAPSGFGDVMFAEPWKGIDTFSVGIDPGGDDPFGMTVLGWGKGNRKVQHLVDWTSPRGARLTWGDVMGVLGKLVATKYPTNLWCYDTNSDTELDTFGHQYGVPVIRAAKKADRPGQIRKMNNVLKPGTFQAMRGSTLVRDFTEAKMGDDGEWTPAYHPTTSECARYAMGAYWLLHKDAPPPAVPQDPLDKEFARIERQHNLNNRRRRR